MTAALLAGLAGLAIVDSTSVGTLVLPILMLIHPNLRAGRYLLYLGTICVFYWLLGLALLAGAEGVVQLLTTTNDSRIADWIQLAVGVGLLAASFWPDTRWARQRSAGAAAGTRQSRWADRLVGPQSSVGTVMAVALAAGLLEAASMVPYLGAVGLINASTEAAPERAAILAGYVAVMAGPAVLLLGLRMALGHRLDRSLERLSAVLGRLTSGAIWWIIGILGFLLATDAIRRLRGPSSEAALAYLFG